MKNLSLFSLLVMIGFIFFLGGCVKEEVLIQQNNTTQFRNNSNWEFEYIYDLMKSMETSDLVNFLNYSGTPSWEHSVQKRSNGLSITSIPIILDNKVNGVIKMYVTGNDSITVKYFEKSALDSIILRADLDAEEFEVYKGAIQSLILTTFNFDETHENKYLQWLIANKSRVTPRVVWHCIEEWLCYKVLTSSATGWSYSDRSNWVRIGFNLGEGWDCTLLSRECWVDFTPRNFPSSTFKSGPGKTNPPIITGGGSSGSGNLTIENAKKEYLTQLLNYKGLNEKYGIIISECIGALVIPEYSQSGLIDVVIDMKCYEAKLNQIAKDLGLSEECIENASIDLIIKLINVADYIDPCTGEPVDKENIYDEFCQNASLGESALDEALDGVDYIIEKELREECPQLYCLYNKMVKSNNNFICKYVTPTFDSDKFKLTFKVEETGAGSSAHVTYDKNSKSSTLTISPTLCNKDKSQVTLMGIMLHEFVHAELARKMSLKGYNINDINDLYKFYPKLAEYIYDIAATQGQDQIHHNIMIQYENIINKMALALYELFDGAANGLSVDHFKMTAANGLFEAMEKNAATNSQFNNLYQEFRTKYEQKGADMQAKNLKLQGCG